MTLASAPCAATGRNPVEFDFFFPTESSQEPMFYLLGTAADRKRRVVYDTSHTIPRTELVREAVQWIYGHLGPVR